MEDLTKQEYEFKKYVLRKALMPNKLRQEFEKEIKEYETEPV